MLFPLPEDLPDPVIKPTPSASLAFTGGSFMTELFLGKEVLRSSVILFEKVVSRW